jgi:pSer/pThr/pTyr-binding forkhead associated (FHA) protein
VSDPIEVLLQFAFLGVLYLFLLWVARSALRDLGRPATEPAGLVGEDPADPGRPYSGRLVVERGGGLASGEAFGIGPGLVIGRALACEITIEDSYASGRHARLYDRDGHVYIEDLNSTNGTYVNGSRVSAQQLLRPGDVIRIGDTELRFDHA